MPAASAGIPPGQNARALGGTATSNAAPVPASFPRSVGHFAKTKMCKFEILGMCTKGTACEFAHSPAEMHASPDLTRTKICKTLIASGECLNPRCTYAHSAAELRPMKTESVRTSSSNRLPSKQPSRRVKRAAAGPASRVPALPANAAPEPFDGQWLGLEPQMAGPQATFVELNTHSLFGSSCSSTGCFDEGAVYMPPAAPYHAGAYSEAGFDGVAAANASGTWWRNNFGEQYGAGDADFPWPLWHGHALDGCQASFEPDDCWASSVGDVSTCDPEDSHRMDDADFRRRPIRLVRSADGALCTLGCDGFEARTSW